MERSPCEACLQTILSGKRALILVCPPLPSPATPPLGLEGAHPLAADPSPRAGLFSQQKSAITQRNPGTPSGTSVLRPSPHSVEEEDCPEKRGLALRLTPRLSLYRGHRLPSVPSEKTATQSGGRWSQRPPALGRLREGGHASAQPGAGTRRSPRPPPLTAETPRRGRAAEPRPHAGPAAGPGGTGVC